MTKRQQILEAVLARLTAITRASGCETDGGLTIVFGENIELGDGDPDDAIGVLVGDDAPQDMSGFDPGDGTVLINLPLQFTSLSRLSTPGNVAWRRVEAQLGDIKRAIEGGDRSLGGLLTKGLMRAPTRTRPRDAGSTTLGAGVGYLLTYTEQLGNPEAD
jgi:hypothetical protein